MNILIRELQFVICVGRSGLENRIASAQPPRVPIRETCRTFPSPDPAALCLGRPQDVMAPVKSTPTNVARPRADALTHVYVPSLRPLLSAPAGHLRLGGDVPEPRLAKSRPLCAAAVPLRDRGDRGPTRRSSPAPRRNSQRRCRSPWHCIRFHCWRRFH